MNVLELFCGTKSVGKVCDKLGWSSVSVDIDKKFNPTHICDIMNFNYKQYDKNYFNIIWASPPCIFYSKLKYTWYGRKNKDNEIYTKEHHEKEMIEADKLIIKTFEIINYFNCKYWFIENPYSCLRNRQIMKSKFYHTIDYCKYSNWGYKKTTCIWTNKKNWVGLKCNNDCENMIILNGQNLHRERMGTHKTIKDNNKIIRCNTAELRKKYKDYKNIQTKTTWNKLEERYRIPEKLILSLFLD